ncbi:hypothetical protein SCHPADRAFT_897966 [Schizopora paradoxa]|uniref:Methyltransferase domain-containing protein n=1 Tax=Schizopora paradoxa TaxID=27342 RepID=A0A0H2SA19_9AGAM|nr:hypothetical protein SCHPADRAFT_897966 [Schizopora paradoxa]
MEGTTENTQLEGSTAPPRFTELTLDPSLYDPSPEQVAFFKQQTGIESDEELKAHILSVQKEAWEIVHYICIRTFGFTKLMISRNPHYPELLKLGRERPGAIYLEFACCFGNDARKAISDGFPMENVICSDIEEPFWNLGHKLFKTTQETFPLAFCPCDVFNTSHITPREPFYSPPETPRPLLSCLTSLNPLQGHVSVIHTAAFFHLFNKEEQIQAARKLASLLSPEPGSMIFGAHSSQPADGQREYTNARGKRIYAFSPEQWEELWNGEIFKKGSVEVKSEIVERDLRMVGPMPALRDRKRAFAMWWCIKRL